MIKKNSYSIEEDIRKSKPKGGFGFDSQEERDMWLSGVSAIKKVVSDDCRVLRAEMIDELTAAEILFLENVEGKKIWEDEVNKGTPNANQIEVLEKTINGNTVVRWIYDVQTKHSKKGEYPSTYYFSNKKKTGTYGH